MAEDTETKNHLSGAKLVFLTAVITLIVSAGGAYFFGFIGPMTKQDTVVVASDGQPGEAKKVLYTCSMHPWILAEEPGLCPICGMNLVPKRDVADSETGKPGERKIAYWRAPMNPTEIYDKPGKSAMGMDLVPVYEDELVGGIEVKVDPVIQQNMGIRTAAVKKGPLVRTIRTYGHVDYDETRTTQISPKFNGWIDELYVDFTGQPVEKDQPLFEIYSPELFTAQEEYLTTYRNIKILSAGQGRELLESARRRLVLFDVPESEILEIEKTGQIRKNLMIRSPSKGIVTHKNAVEGMYVKAGTTVYTVADLSRVWVEAHIYEYELPWVVEGQPADMTLSYVPGKVFHGKVAYVYPYLQQKTRDVVVRLEFENPDMELKPQMYADVRIKSIQKGEGIVVPTEAVLRTGERDIVFVEREGGKFTPREVTLGLSLDDGQVQVLKGLAPGETVVTSGQFMLDSESRLKEAVQKMLEARRAPPPKVPETEKPEEDFFKEMEEDEFFKGME